MYLYIYTHIYIRLRPEFPHGRFCLGFSDSHSLSGVLGQLTPRAPRRRSTELVPPWWLRAPVLCCIHAASPGPEVPASLNLPGFVHLGHSGHPGEDRACTLAPWTSPSLSASSTLWTRTSPWCMTILLLYTLALVFDILLHCCNGIPHCTSELETQESSCSQGVVLALKGHHSTWTRSFASGVSYPTATSFEGRPLPSSDPKSNVEATSRQCRLDVWQLQKTPCQECLVLRSLWICVGRLYHLPQEENDASTVFFEESLLDRTRSCSLDRRFRREESSTKPKDEEYSEESWQGQREVKAATFGTPTSTTNRRTRRSVASLDEHAFATGCIFFHCFSNDSVISGAEVERRCINAQEGQPRDADPRIATLCCGRDQSCDKEGCKDIIHRRGRVDKSSRSSGHGTPGAQQFDGAVASLFDDVTGKISSIHGSFPTTRAGPSREHQNREGGPPESQGRLQHRKRRPRSSPTKMGNPRKIPPRSRRTRS